MGSLREAWARAALHMLGVLGVGVLPALAVAGESASSFGSYATGEGFALFTRVETSNCPRAFRDAWDQDYQRLRRISDVFDEAARDYERQKRALLAEKTWWGAPAYSEAAAQGTDALHAVKLAADEFMALAELAAPNGIGHAYKVVSQPKDAVEFVNSVREGQVVKAVYAGANVLEIVPSRAKPLSELIANLAEWRESRRNLDEYREELRAALERLDRNIADTRTRIGAAQQSLRERTERGLREFCDERPSMVAVDDQVAWPSDSAGETCLDVRRNDRCTGCEMGRVRVTAVGVRQRAAGTVNVGPGGSCVRYRPPEVFLPPGMDRFDYQIEDERGRRATGTVRVTSVYCSMRTTLDTVSGLDLCPRAPERATAPPVPNPHPAVTDPSRGRGPATDCASHQLVEFDGACYERDGAEALAAQKCSAATGWGSCSEENRRLAEAYARREHDAPCPGGGHRYERATTAVEYLNRTFCARDDDDARLQSGGDSVHAVSASRGVTAGAERPASSAGTPSAAASSTVSAVGAGGSGAAGPATAAASRPGSGPRAASSGDGAGAQPSAGADASGQACQYFTRPAVEYSDDLGVRSVRMNYYADGTEVCHGAARYRCEKRRWVKFGDGCGKDDARQAWRLEGTSPDGAAGEPGRSDPGAGNPGGGEGGVASPFDPVSPLVPGGSPFGDRGAQSPWAGAHVASSGSSAQGGSRAGNRSAGSGSDSMDAQRSEMQCRQDAEAMARDLERLCPLAGNAGMCSTYREAARCMQQIINRTMATRCPDEVKQRTVAAGRNAIEQMRSNARQVCSNGPGF